jgi:HlyD family type I secretion membrane fusion protein
MVLFFGIGGAAAAFAPVQSATIIAGQISTAQLRSAVQSIEGGTLAMVRVREGQMVRRGELLATLEEVRFSAQYETALRLERQLAAELARVEAERRGEAAIVFDHPSLSASNSDEVAELMRSQTQMLLASRQLNANRRQILQRQAEQHRHQIAAAEKQVAIVDTQLPVLAEQVASIEAMLRRGFATRPRLLEAQSQQAELASRRAQLEGSIAQLTDAMSGVRLQMLEIDNEARDELGQKETELRMRLAEAERNATTARDQVKKAELRAPADGFVFALRHSAPGAVVAPGEKLMEIVPNEAQLTIRARLSPLDIDSIYAGQRVRVVLSGLPREAHHNFYGEIFEIGADLQKTTDGSAFYEVLARLDRGEVTRRIGNVKLVSGMPVSVFAEGPSRTLFDYIMDPIVSVIENGMREK